MRNIFMIYFLSILLYSTAYTQINIEVSYSKPLAMFRFLEVISGHDVNTNEQILNYLFEEEDSNLQSVIELFNITNLDYTYTWEEMPDTRKKTRSTYDLLLMNLASTQNVADVPQKLVSIIPYLEIEHLVACLKEIEPYYDAYITQKYASKIQDEINAYQKIQKTLSEKLLLVKELYGAYWPENLPFIISLYPTPGKSGYIYGSPSGNVLICNYLADSQENPEHRIGVALNEACLVFYDAQPIPLQKNIEKWFLLNPSKYAKLSYKYFEESLAASVGNGWLYQQLHKKRDPLPWHSVSIQNEYARALLGLVEDYIQQNRSIDSMFVVECIDIFEATFPKSIYEYEPLLQKANIYATVEDQNYLKNIGSNVRDYFKTRSYEIFSPLKSAETIQSIQESKGSKIFIVDSKYRMYMNYLKTILPDLSENLQQVRVPFKRNQYFSYLNQHGEAILIILSSNNQQLQKIMEHIVNEKYINPDYVMHELN